VRSAFPPLFLQHDGHSRTIVGVERRRATPAERWRYLLLLFDPSTVESQRARRTLDAMVAATQRAEDAADRPPDLRGSPSAIEWAACIKRLQATALPKAQYEIAYFPRRRTPEACAKVLQYAEAYVDAER
jgi:hypothetical protein